jgi:fucose permease
MHAVAKAELTSEANLNPALTEPARLECAESQTHTGFELTNTQDKFKRDRLTWRSYLLYGFWAFAWGLFAPLMPFLRTELKLTYSAAALHFSALAFGLLVAGISGSRILSRVQATPAVWSGSAGIAAGLLLLLVAQNCCCSVAAALLIGFCGSIAGQALMASVAERFARDRAVAIAELVIANSLFSMIAPLAVAGVLSCGLPWRFAIALPLVAVAVSLWFTKSSGTRSWQLHQSREKAAGRLPLAYWIYFAIITVCVSAEWSITFWCPDYLEHGLHLSRANACTGLSVFLFAMLAGRALGSKIANWASTSVLLIIATAIAAVGFFMFWCSHHVFLVMAGLVILGLGESNCYPFALAAAINAAPGKTTQATSTMSIATGSAILLAPLVLGLVADQMGIVQAYGIVAILLIAATATASYAALILQRKAER